MAAYDELRVHFSKAGDAYTVTVRSPAGEVAAPFVLTASPLEIENLVLRMSRRRTAVRRVDSPELELVRRFGGELFASVFAGPVRDFYRSAFAAARTRGHGLRITLALDETPELMHLPWEYLYEEPSFLAISTWTPVVRSLELPHGRRPLAITPPLRVLAMVSSPTDVVGLDVGLERQKLEEALAEPVARGSVEITWLEQATLSALQRSLRRADYHVFHYVGHGLYDGDRQDGLLLLEDDDGRSRSVSGVHLGTMLADEWSLRLAVLNACEGARTSTSDPFAGVAASLIQREIPAVVAMQFEITDRAAVVFAGEFYAAVADGYAVDAALAEARKAIYADENDIEWATPVLFMRAAEGLIFDVAEPVPRAVPDKPAPEPEAAPEPPPTPLPEADEPVREPDPKAEPWDEPDAEPETWVAPAPDPWDQLEPEPQPKPQPERQPERQPPAQPRPQPARPPATAELVIGGLAAAVVLALTLLVPWDDAAREESWQRFYDASASGAHGSLAALAVPVGALVAVALAFGARTRSFAAGVLLGIGASAAALHGGVLVRMLLHEVDTPAPSLALFLLAVAAALVLVVLGARVALREPPDHAEPRPGAALTAALAIASVLVLAGTVVSFTGGGTNASLGRGGAAAVLPDRWPEEPWGIFHPLLVALGAATAAALARHGGRRLAGGLLVALGAVGALVWWRYAIVPIDLRDDIGSAGPGGFLGLAGALVVLAVGVALAGASGRHARGG